MSAGVLLFLFGSLVCLLLLFWYCCSLNSFAFYKTVLLTFCNHILAQVAATSPSVKKKFPRPISSSLSDIDKCVTNEGNYGTVPGYSINTKPQFLKTVGLQMQVVLQIYTRKLLQFCLLQFSCERKWLSTKDILQL